jgi:hypothetical protein
MAYQSVLIEILLGAISKMPANGERLRRARDDRVRRARRTLQLACQRPRAA